MNIYFCVHATRYALQNCVNTFKKNFFFFGIYFSNHLREKVLNNLEQLLTEERKTHFRIRSDRLKGKRVDFEDESDISFFGCQFWNLYWNAYDLACTEGASQKLVSPQKLLSVIAAYAHLIKFGNEFCLEYLHNCEWFETKNKSFSSLDRCLQSNWKIFAHNLSFLFRFAPIS